MAGTYKNNLRGFVRDATAFGVSQGADQICAARLARYTSGVKNVNLEPSYVYTWFLGLLWILTGEHENHKDGSPKTFSSDHRL